MAQLPQDELTEYLERRSIPPDEARQIMALYAQAVATANAATWSRDRIYEWLDEQITALDAGEPAGGGDAQTGPASVRLASEAVGARAADAAEGAARQADERAAAVRARQRGMDEFVTDMGSAVDPGMISTSLAVGAWVDENGNYINPVTRQPVDQPIAADANSLWQMIRGQKFNMGTLAMPGYEERRTKNYTPLRRGFTGTEPGTRSSTEGGARLLNALGVPTPGYNLNRPTSTRVLTPSQAMALLNNMDEDYLLQIQQGMWDAGLYAQVGEGARPDWGEADAVTQKAFQALFLEASADPRKPINQVLADLAERNIAGLGDVPGAPGSSSGQAPDFTPQVASEETLSQLIDDLAADMLGENVSPEQKRSLISRLQAKEIENQRQTYEQDLARYNAGSASGVPGMEDIDVFMDAISGQESGGDYGAVNKRTGAYGRFQIMPGNWRPWATRAGLGPNAPRTPENQEIVARRIMMDYFAQFGNWRDVAVAWFAGPGAVDAAGAENRSDGNMTVREYADGILDRMASLRGGAPAAGAAVGQEYGAIERFDPAAEAEAALKAANPDAWFGHQFGERAGEFFGLLGGVV